MQSPEFLSAKKGEDIARDLERLTSGLSLKPEEKSAVDLILKTLKENDEDAAAITLTLNRASIKNPQLKEFLAQNVHDTWSVGREIKEETDKL